jgi:Flp pilus assembly protein TadG
MSLPDKPTFTRRGRAIVQRGSVTLEAILAIPLLTIAIFACFVYGSIATTEGALRNAALEAAREAAKTPTHLGAADAARVADAAKDTVKSVLAIYGLSPEPGGKIEIVVQDFFNQPGVTINPQGIPNPPAPAVALDAKTVQVYVRVKFADAKVPNFLQSFGFDLSAKYFEVKAIARRDG